MAWPNKIFIEQCIPMVCNDLYFLKMFLYFHIYFIAGEKAPCYSSVKLLEDSLKTDLRCKDFDNWSYGIDNVDGSAVIRHFGIKLSQDSDDSNK